MGGLDARPQPLLRHLCCLCPRCLAPAALSLSLDDTLGFFARDGVVGFGTSRIAMSVSLESLGLSEIIKLLKSY